MLNKVVSTLQRTVRDAGFVTLRFNYRGAGQSEGSHDMGSGEVDDAQAAFAWLRAKHPGLPLTLLGFSFGGFVAGSLGGAWKPRARPWRAYSWWRLPSCASKNPSACPSGANSR